MENTTLQRAFQEWLEGYAQRKTFARDFESLMSRLDYACAGGSFTRDELNER